ncbi:hypothetical protein [Herbiconiux sp. YIM B11900]|uniref:hypothetical protein n=1 Tax=Herbiconiux sp. YIM B11900 TaxID=3404131 RepID=UPI003F82A69C
MTEPTEDLEAFYEACAARFEAYEPRDEDLIDGQAYFALYDAAAADRRGEPGLSAAVAAARAGNVSWVGIGAVLGTTGDVARRRFGTEATRVVG